MTDPKAFLRSLFEVAVAAALPEKVLHRFLPERPAGRVLVVGAGKGSAAMAAALERALDGPLEGLVVTRYGHAVPCQHIEIVEAAHPVPDAAGGAAAARMLAMADALGPDDLMIALISGGGSSLLTLPAEGMSLADKQAVNAALLRSGAPIDEMNVLRKHLSRIKGGRLAAAAFPARTVTLVISDVPGDDPGAVASGPTVPDASTVQDAKAVIARYGLTLPQSVHQALDSPMAETVKPDAPELAGNAVHLIATPRHSLLAAAEVARAAGVKPLILGDALEGEAREVGRALAGVALSAADHGQPIAGPAVLLSGGETTVRLPDGAEGRGGRNVEFLMGLAAGLGGHPRIFALAGDTDGVDGAAEVAGAVVGPDTLSRARERGYPLPDAMARYDGHGFFEALGDEVITGPTLTNVNDFRAILIL